MEDLTGKQLGPYQIVAPVGEGGMAAVYKAYQPGMDRYVALKILPQHYASDPRFVKRFEREATIIAKLQHIHILPVHDYGEAEGYTYIVMPFVQTGTLADIMTGKPLSMEQIERMVEQIGAALDYAHSRGVIHRDIKPSNILIDEGGNCLLTDFGIGKILTGSTQITHTGDVIGTPAYMSPEQGLGEELDQRSDVYSLGVMLYEMVTGRPPYAAETPMAIIIKHVHAPLPPPRTIDPTIPESIERVVLKALAKDKESRYPTTKELAQTFKAALAMSGAGATEIRPPVIPIPGSEGQTVQVDGREAVPDATTQRVTQLRGQIETRIAAKDWSGARALTTQLESLGMEGRLIARGYQAELPKPRQEIPSWIWGALVGGIVIVGLVLLGLGLVWFLNRDSESPSLESTQAALNILQTQTAIAEAGSALERTQSAIDDSTNASLQTKTATSPVVIGTITPTEPPPTNTTAPSDTPKPTNTPGVTQITFTASQNMYCRDGPDTYYEEHTMVMNGETVPVRGKWYQDSDWLLVEIDKPSITRTRCCWVGGEGSTNVSLGSIPSLDYLVDRLTCERR